MIFKYPESLEVGGEKLYRPVVPILFKNDNYFALLEGTIDSGADYILLPISIAQKLNIKLKKKTQFYSAGGGKFTVYRSPVKIEYILRKDGFGNISHKTIVYFAESQTTILLGNYGFLEKFKVTLNGPKKEVEIIDGD